MKAQLLGPNTQTVPSGSRQSHRLLATLWYGASEGHGLSNARSCVMACSPVTFTVAAYIRPIVAYLLSNLSA